MSSPVCGLPAAGGQAGRIASLVRLRAALFSDKRRVTSDEQSRGGLCIVTDARPFPFLRKLHQATPHGIREDIFYRSQNGNSG